jgi:hypothetical protein
MMTLAIPGCINQTIQPFIPNLESDTPRKNNFYFISELLVDVWDRWDMAVLQSYE